MAASVRLEDEAFGDGRYDHLGALMGTTKYDALGRLAFLWRQCTAEQTYVLPESYVRVFVDPEHLIESRLGERVAGGIRIRGTRGRIEWLGKLRKAARKGGKALSAKRHASRHLQGMPQGVPSECPPAPAPAPAPAPTDQRDTEAQPPVASSSPESLRSAGPPCQIQTEISAVVATVKPPAKSRGRGKHKPSEQERAVAMAVLGKLGARNGTKYTGTDKHVGLITDRLRAGYTEHDLDAVAALLDERWRDDPKMREHLEPPTLWGPEKIQNYIDKARTKYARQLERGEPIPGPRSAAGSPLRLVNATESDEPWLGGFADVPEVAS